VERLYTMVTRSLAIDDPSSWFCRHETSKRGAAALGKAPGTKKNPATFFLSPAIRKHQMWPCRSSQGCAVV
jgi:hypothetical protein